ncbi:MAG: toll/interleukin-1 receptor domain-containing protein [bacterium]|nr:toll/interleukin-1 receptor domain-containing protein [bacterium]
MVRKLKCFISASAETDTKVLRKILQNNGIIVFDMYDIQSGMVVEKELRRKIKEADFVIAILSENCSYVYYEIGICEGIEKPLFIIIDKNFKMPSYLQNHVHLETSLQDNQLLNISISKFTNEVVTNKKYFKQKNKKTSLSGEKTDIFHNYITKLQLIREKGSGVELGNLTGEIFNELKLQFVSKQYSIGDKGADFAIWVNSVNFSIGNPIFIEVEYGQLSPQKIYNSEKRIQKYIEKTDAKAGILFYLDKNEKRFYENYSLSPLILRFDIEDFVRELSSKNFDEIILRTRNKMVHGIID